MKTLIFLIISMSWVSAGIPDSTKQAIIGISKNWNSSHVTLRVYEKKGNTWEPVTPSWSGRLGRNGLAWGLGIHGPIPSNAPIKKEGDGRAPAGIFKLGGAYGYAAKFKTKLPYHQITAKDLWVEDSTSPYYNRHLILDELPKTTWQKKAQMRQNDYPHSLKLYIAHNDSILSGKKAIPDHGSAIFFHIWRGGGSKPTAGCTTMSEASLKRLIQFIDPEKNPIYVLLPEKEYKSLRKVWKLP